MDKLYFDEITYPGSNVLISQHIYHRCVQLGRESEKKKKLKIFLSAVVSKFLSGLTFLIVFNQGHSDPYPVPRL